MAQPHLHSALDRLLAVDDKRQREEREPTTELENLAHEIICKLGKI